MQTDFHIDQIVWAKVGGHPWWPAFIRKILQNNKFEIIFFGDFSKANLSLKNIKKYDANKKRPKKIKAPLRIAMDTAQRILNGESNLVKEWKLVEDRNLKELEKINERNKEKAFIKSKTKLSMFNDSESNTRIVDKEIEQVIEKEEQINQIQELENEAAFNKRLYSINDSKAETFFLEVDSFDTEIKKTEDTLNSLYIRLENRSVKPKEGVNIIESITGNLCRLDPKKIFSSKIGNLIVKCIQRCDEQINKDRQNNTRSNFRGLLKSLKELKKTICCFIIDEGFLTEKNSFDEISQTSKRNSFTKQPVSFESPAPSNIDKPKTTIEEPKKEKTDILFTPKKSKSQRKAKKPKQLKVPNKIAFRVKKRLARLFLNYLGGSRLSKRIYERMGVLLENEIVKTSPTIEEYKTKVVCVVKEAKKNYLILNGFISLKEKTWCSETVRCSLSNLMDS